MQREVKKYLFDIQCCIENIENYLGQPVVFANFENNMMLQQAIERNLEIIGEAINSILKIYPQIKITNARRMVDTRNKIIHAYDDIQPAQIWNIIINHLPLLKKEIQTLLNY